MFGAGAGSSNLTWKTNAAVAALFQSDYALPGNKLEAQVLAAALAVYVTDPNLNTTGVGTSYGFIVSGHGVGAATWNVGANGAAFGVANNSVLTVMDLLMAVNNQAVNGVLYNGNATLRGQSTNVFGGISQAGGIN
jgi:hypothetical protein